MLSLNNCTYLSSERRPGRGAGVTALPGLSAFEGPVLTKGQKG